MKNLKMKTKDLANENIKKIGELFPNCVTESRKINAGFEYAIDFNKLRQELSKDIVEGDETYDFTWVGKKACMVEANSPTNKTLRPCKEDSVNWDKTENLYIEGDNREVLKLLQESYLGKVKMIYIDPPYNTGNDLIYRDDFTQDREDYEEDSGEVDEEGNRLFRNTESNGRFHSDWCSMMYSRLKLAKNLLSDEGAILISIDECELVNIKKIMDEIFNEYNFCNIVSIKTKTAGVSGSFMGKSLLNNTEYLLIYCKNHNTFSFRNLPKKRQELIDYIESYTKNGKSWKYTTVLLDEGTRRKIKTIKDSAGDEIIIYEHNNYKFASIAEIAKNKHDGKIKEAYYENIDKIFRTTNAQSSIRQSIIANSKDINSEFISIDYVPKKGKHAGEPITLYYKDKKRNMLAFLKDVVERIDDGIYKIDNSGTFWDDINYNNLSNEAGIVFPNGQKPVFLLNRLVNMICDKNDTILDFFSGSATTAHAVMQLNAEDGGNRKYVMVQYPEEIVPKTKELEKYIKYLDKEGIEHFVTEIGKERIRRAAKKIHKDNPDAKFDDGFRVFKLDSSNMKDVYYAPDEYTKNILDLTESNIKEDRTDLDLLYQCLLDLGLSISKQYKSEKIDGFNVHTYNGDALVACFDQNITDTCIKEIAKRKPLRVVFRDSSFKDSPSKINVEEMFKMLSPKTTVRVI